MFLALTECRMGHTTYVAWGKIATVSRADNQQKTHIGFAGHPEDYICVRETPGEVFAKIELARNTGEFIV